MKFTQEFLVCLFGGELQGLHVVGNKIDMALIVEQLQLHLTQNPSSDLGPHFKHLRTIVQLTILISLIVIITTVNFGGFDKGIRHVLVGDNPLGLGGVAADVKVEIYQIL